VTEKFLPLLEKSKGARLVYVSSGLGSINMRLDPKDPYKMLQALAYRMSKAAINMLVACDVMNYGPKGMKVWAFDPGYVVTNLSGTGEKGKRERVKNGAGDPKVSAKALAAVLAGKRDEDVGKFIHENGVYPW
jgi:NAD(P)-dependent dehydrogenase (short-subunit alcohol dehydrogenase family)